MIYAILAKQIKYFESLDEENERCESYIIIPGRTSSIGVYASRCNKHRHSLVIAKSWPRRPHSCPRFPV